MAPESSTRLQVIRAAHGLMYLFAAIAGFYGLLRPASTVLRLYGPEANRMLVLLIVTGGAMGTYAYAMRLPWLEMVGIPFLAVPTALICPALFYGDFSAHQTAWTGWLCAVLVFALVSRWLDVRALRAYASRHRRG